MKNRILDLFQKKQNLIALCVCAAGIILNLLFGTMVSALGLPIYLDTVGTVFAAVMGGFLPAVIVGFLTNIILSISTPSLLYFGVINVMIAVAAAYLVEQRKLKKLKLFIWLIVSQVLIAGIFGALIPTFMYGIDLGSEFLSNDIYGTGLFSKIISDILSNLIMNLLDKALAVTIAFLIYRLIPAKYRRRYNFTGWMQAPAGDIEDIYKGSTKVRRMSLRLKLMLVFMLSLTIVAVAGIAISARVYRKTIINEHAELAKGTARLAASVVDGDRINDYLEDGEAAEGYNETKKMLGNILYTSSEVAYLYVCKMEEDGYRIVFDVETEDVPAEEIGTLIQYEAGYEPYIPRLLEGKDVEPLITKDDYGYLLTAFVPVYDSFGKCSCYAIADVDIVKLIAYERSFLVEMITVFLSFFILLCAFVIWLTNYHIIFPVKTITDTVDGFSFAEDSQTKLDDEVRTIRSIDLHTGDELERLYKSICRMTKNQAEQMRSIRRLSDSTAKMQDGLIITMADMVENRDSDTGAHIQKTAAYVKIIAEGLRKKGYYAEKLTPKFISDAIRSAPLHDVGKINIPDEVLNKPGKLTDEEYEIMKTHTTAGKRIMEHAINTVEGDSYLKEARNMAAYHHERWDGKGYPEKLHGEVIPLSARMMAVADVFDALTSPRIYKPAFPLEKALAIIEEGKGTQFDPKCVEVFMESLSEVKVILRKYNNEQ
ncbi:MAG: HD domain-containing protein [Lachnospiraceae bacterium]|nr:HD domain-containing protein [Lachnospiraceae bacterium]